MKLIVKLFCLMLLGTGTAWSAVNINTASQAELEGVRGLGPSKAKAIISYREKNGAFKSLDDLDNVKGFGKASIEKLRPELTAGEAEGAKAAAAKTKKQ